MEMHKKMRKKWLTKDCACVFAISIVRFFDPVNLDESKTVVVSFSSTTVLQIWDFEQVHWFIANDLVWLKENSKTIYQNEISAHVTNLLCCCCCCCCCETGEIAAAVVDVVVAVVVVALTVLIVLFAPLELTGVGGNELTLQWKW